MKNFHWLFQLNEKDRFFLKVSIYIAIISFTLSLLAGFIFSKISFSGWQKKVAREALENIKLEQTYCENLIKIVSEKMDKLNLTEKNQQIIVSEYFDNIRNQLVSLRLSINKSKSTWDNIFPQVAEDVAKKDREVIQLASSVQSLDQDVNGLAFAYDANKDENMREKLISKTKELNQTAKTLDYNIKAYNHVQVNLSNVVTPVTAAAGIVVLPNGEYVDVNGIIKSSDAKLKTYSTRVVP